MRSDIALHGIATALALVVGSVAAADFPSKPLRILTAEPGGGNDFAARLIAHGMTGNLGQQVIVENRGGASGAMAARTVAGALPDGYTLLLYSGSLWIFPLLKSDVEWNVFRDFAPLTLVASSPSALIVTPSLPAKTVQDLIALARAKPGQLNYGSGSTGASTHLAAELFKAMAHVDIVRVPYKGNAAGYIDMLSGNVQMTFGTAGASMPYIKSGRLHALAVTSTQPSALFPGLPTISASGLPGYESVSMYGMFVPVRMPAALVQRLNHEIVRVIKNPEVQQQFRNAGVEGVGSSPEQLTAAIKSEITRLGKVIKEAGIRAE